MKGKNSKLTATIRVDGRHRRWTGFNAAKLTVKTRERAIWRTTAVNLLRDTAHDDDDMPTQSIS